MGKICLGTIPGERPAEYVIVGAHFDHLGTDETLANDIYVLSSNIKFIDIRAAEIGCMSKI